MPRGGYRCCGGRIGNSMKIKDWGCLTLLLAAVLFFFQDALLGSRTLIWDAADYFYPYFFTVSSILRGGEMPLWNPFLFNGFPTIANIEAQIFYPLNFLFLPFTPFTPYVVHLSLILHCFLAGVFMYLLARNSIENRWACLVSALAYMFSGFFVGHFEHVTMVEVMVWLPLVFLLLEKAILQNKTAYAVFAGFALGISILAGHPQTSHGIIFVLGVHTAYRAATIYVKERNKSAALYASAMLVVCLGIGVIIAAVQILPTFELVKESTRGSAVAFDLAAKGGQLSLKDAVLLIVPNYFGALTGPYWGDFDISQHIIYIGVAPFLLAWLALLCGRKRADMIYFFVMAVFSLTLALGENSPVFSLLYQYLPGFKYFRGPANTLFIYTFFAALLSGHGFSSLAGGLRKLSLLHYAGAVLLFCIVLYLSPAPPAGLKVPAAENILSGFQVFLGLLMLSAVIIFISVSYPRFRNYCFAALLVITFSDLYLHFSGAITIGVKESPGIYEKQPDLITAIKKDSGVEASGMPAIELNKSEVDRGLFRIYTKPEGLRGTSIFGYNRAMLFKTFLVEGFEPLEISRHRRLIDTLSSKNPDNLWKIMNVKYVTSIDQKMINIRRYEAPLPRTYIVANVRFMDNDDRVLDALAVFDPASEVIVSGNGRDVTGQAMNDSDWTSRVSRYTGSLVEIRTQSRKEGFLVFSDTYYPGWQAWVDGVEYPVMRANYDFRAVQLPAGEHTVVFKFTSRYLMAGLLISLAGILIVGFCFFKTIFTR
jgi:hypothetical protein